MEILPYVWTGQGLARFRHLLSLYKNVPFAYLIDAHKDC